MSDTPRGTGEPGQERPALEDRQPSADQDHVSVTDVESEQVSEYAHDEEFEGAELAQDGEHTKETDGENTAATSDPVVSVLDIEGLPDPDPRIVRTIEALLFLAPDSLSPQELSDAAAAEELAVIAALAELAERYAPGRSGINLRELGGGFTFASDPETEESARRLFSRPRASVLTPAQAETLAIVAYLQPISRPEITRIRGVSADSAASTLLERGLVEESGRSQFGAVMYRTTTQFLKLFGLRTLDELPDVGQWDPSPEEQAELRDRLLRAGEARAGGGPQPELQ
ncbi:MAG TPA: SMC-Scp complex subunit ScpB [Solirubrobacteraceae bacterium]|jgi:segregation and condensation protein B